MSGMSRFKIIGAFAVLMLLFFGLFNVDVYAGVFPGMNTLWEGTDDPAEVVPVLQTLFLVSIIALAPSLLVMFTGFVRIIIVLSFMRQAMATQMMPPNQVLIGIALFLTMFIMTPVLQDINQNALQPFGAGELSIEEALSAGMEPIRRFMKAHVQDADVSLFLDLANEYFDTDDLPNHVLIPAFILGEITAGFVIGFMIYLPFIAVDMVVASVLMAMGMMMLPPAMISLPFKVLLFVLVDGWQLIIGGVVESFWRYS